MTQVVVTHKFPGGKPGQILDLDDRTRKAVRAGNARLLPSADGSAPQLELAVEETHRLRGTGNADWDEHTAPGDKGPETLDLLAEGENCDPLDDEEDPEG